MAVTTAQGKVDDSGPSVWTLLKQNRNWLGFWYMLPALGFLVVFLAYPLGLGVWLSMTDAQYRSGRRVCRA